MYANVTPELILLCWKLHLPPTAANICVPFLHDALLLGLEMELFYVREGVVNEYALNFQVPVPSTIEMLHFSWASLANRPVSIIHSNSNFLLHVWRYLTLQLPYNMHVETSDSAALTKPELNISTSGFIPTTLQVFSLSLPCEEGSSAEVDVLFTINITLTPMNTTSLTLKRKKICLKLDSLTNNYVLVDSMPSQPNGANIFYVAVGCALTLITIIALSVVTRYIQHKKARPVEDSSTRPHSSFLPGPSRNAPTTSTYGSFRRMPSYSLIDERTKDIQERITELTIQRYGWEDTNWGLLGVLLHKSWSSYNDERHRLEIWTWFPNGKNTQDQNTILSPN